MSALFKFHMVSRSQNSCFHKKKKQNIVRRSVNQYNEHNKQKLEKWVKDLQTKYTEMTLDVAL